MACTPFEIAALAWRLSVAKRWPFSQQLGFVPANSAKRFRQLGPSRREMGSFQMERKSTGGVDWRISLSQSREPVAGWASFQGFVCTADGFDSRNRLNPSALLNPRSRLWVRSTARRLRGHLAYPLCEAFKYLGAFCPSDILLSMIMRRSAGATSA